MEAALAFTEKEFCTWLELVEDCLHTDLTGDAQEGNATIVIADGTAFLLVERDKQLLPPVTQYYFHTPDPICNNLQPADTLLITQLQHLCRYS